MGEVLFVDCGALRAEENEAEETRDGAIVAGGEKKVPSSRVSRKSLDQRQR